MSKKLQMLILLSLYHLLISSVKELIQGFYCLISHAIYIKEQYLTKN